jgi:hypothetical protein
MDTARIIRDLAVLPRTQQKEIADYIEFLKKRYKKTPAARTARPRKQKLSTESFTGIWQNRKDMKNSFSWVRNTRLSEWPE